MIEGGCGFYLSYALTSGDAFIEFSKLQAVQKIVRDMINNKYEKDWGKWYLYHFF